MPGIIFDNPIPGCLEIGKTLVVEGATTTREIPDLVMVPSNPASPRLEDGVSASAGGGFRAEFTPESEDLHRIEVGPIGPRPQVRFGPIYVASDCSGD